MTYRLHNTLNAAVLTFFVFLASSGSITFVEGDCIVEGDVVFDDSSEVVPEQRDGSTTRPIYSMVCNNAERYSPVLRDYRALESAMLWELEQISSKRENTKMADSRVSGIKRTQSLECGSDGDQRYCSLCPWRERNDTNTSRTPVTVWKAECLNNSCDFNHMNLDQTSNRLLSLYTTCEEIRRDVRIILNGGEESYLDDWPIACMCTQQHVASGSDITVSAVSTDSMPNIIFDEDADIRINESVEHLPVVDADYARRMNDTSSTTSAETSAETT